MDCQKMDLIEKVIFQGPKDIVVLAAPPRPP